MDGDIMSENASKTRPRGTEALVSPISLNNVNTLNHELVGSWRAKGGQAVGDVEAYICQMGTGGLADAPLWCVQAGWTECMRRALPMSPVLTREISRARREHGELCNPTPNQIRSQVTLEKSAPAIVLRAGESPVHFMEDRGKGLAGPMNFDLKGGSDV